MNTITILISSVAGIVAFLAGFAAVGSAFVTIGILAAAAADYNSPRLALVGK